jgi:prepilin peptidase CpaA
MIMEYEYTPILYVTTFVFMASMLAALVLDCWKFVIPNSISIVVTVDFFVAAFLLPIQTHWVSHLGAAASVFAIGLALYRFRVLGAGDIKLMTAVSLWTGFEMLHLFLLYTALAGGALSLGLIFLRYLILTVQLQCSPSVLRSVPRLLRNGESIPYGLAIAVGGSSLMFQRSHLLPPIEFLY